MSAKNFKLIHPKPIYQNIEFRSDPYTVNEKFNIFVPKEQDKIAEMIEKSKRQTQQTKQCQPPKQESVQPEYEITSPKEIKSTNEPAPSPVKQQKVNSLFLKLTLLDTNIEGEEFKAPERQPSIPKTTLKNEVVENIISDGEVIVQKPVLVNQILKLKELNVLKNKQFNQLK